MLAGTRLPTVDLIAIAVLASTQDPIAPVACVALAGTQDPIAPVASLVLPAIAVLAQVLPAIAVLAQAWLGRIATWVALAWLALVAMALALVAWLLAKRFPIAVQSTVHLA